MNKRGHVINGALLAIGVGYILEPSGDVETFETIATVGLPIVLGAMLPDIDTAFGKHRKTLHNLPLIVALYFWPEWFATMHYVWMGVLTHYVLDVMGSKRGIALFYPLTDEEFGLPIGVSTSSKYADAMTLLVTAIELAAVFAIVHYELPVQNLSEGASVAIGL
ncbi:MAG: metal-dependent hydrolase [Halobacteriales archaeon]